VSFKKNEIASIHFSMRDLGGQLPSTSLSSLTCKVRKDDGNFASATNTPDEDAAVFGHYELELTATEMNANVVTVLVQKTGYRDFEHIIYPEPKMVDDLKDESMRGTDNAPAAADIITALKAEDDWLTDSGSGTMDFQTIVKVLTSWAAGKVVDSGVAGTYNVLDPEDDSTVIMTITPSETTPYKDTTIL
jgi:hypothetical protein